MVIPNNPYALLETLPTPGLSHFLNGPTKVLCQRKITVNGLCWGQPPTRLARSSVYQSQTLHEYIDTLTLKHAETLQIGECEYASPSGVPKSSNHAECLPFHPLTQMPEVLHSLKIHVYKLTENPFNH